MSVIFSNIIHKLNKTADTIIREELKKYALTKEGTLDFRL